jgi:ADP-heptose:LPS heptosyltransferase
MFFIIPVIRYLKKTYPNCILKMASGCKQPLENLPELDELYDMPFDAKVMEEVDYHLMFQGIIESSSEEANRTHAADMFFKYFSIDSTPLTDDDKRPRLFFTEDEMAWRDKTVGEAKITEMNYVIGVQLETSAPLRNFPKEKLKAIIDILSKENGVHIFLIGAAQQNALAAFYKGNHPNVHIATSFSVRQSIILATRYDQIISPDTFMVQTAGALDTPLVGLYGPFPSEVRMKYFKNAIGIEPDVICSPCFKHDFRACIKGYPSPCFSQVTVDQVLQAVDYFKHKFTGQHFGYMQRLLSEPFLEDIEHYFLSADKGLCFFPGYYKHHNMIRVDDNRFVRADVDDLSTEFQRGAFPFVLYMNEFSQRRIPVYNGSKNMVRPGGHFIVYKADAPEQFLQDITKDVGKSFAVMYSKYDPIAKTAIVVGKRPY